MPRRWHTPSVSPRRPSLSRTVIELGHCLGMSVTAEGIDTDAQLGCMRDLGCDVYQGFLFSKPVPVEQFVALLAAKPGQGSV